MADAPDPMPGPTSAPVDEAFVPARSPSVFTVELDGEAVLLDEAAARLHLLNPTGTLLWELYDGETPLGVLADEVATELGVSRTTVLDDIVAITVHLADEGLLA